MAAGPAVSAVLAAAQQTVTRASFLSARFDGRRAIYNQLLLLHDSVAEAERPSVEELVKAVCGVHPYHFLSGSDRVLPLYHLTAQRQRKPSLHFPPEHAATYPAPAFSEFGPADYVDSFDNWYRSEPRFADNVLLVRLARTKKRQAVGEAANPWNLPLPSEPLVLRARGGTARAEVTVTTSVFNTQAGYVPRKTGSITFTGRLPTAAPGSAAGPPPARGRRKRKR
jgi:hypothetical protein|tara:strand:+ start:269 stop:943 length:675 start_codon:yes stop_codon:yes gene_type:complete